jgi:hypothetical protein
MSREQQPPATGNESPAQPADPGTRAAGQPGHAGAAATALDAAHDASAYPTSQLTAPPPEEHATGAVVRRLASASLPANAESAPHLPTVGSVDTHGAHGVAACANCGALVTGHFCGNCGQRREHEIHSIWHFTQEATEDLTHADSRLWSTMIALLLKPGLLTREFLAGRRVKYLPPLRLYLVLSVRFFLILSFGNHDPKAISYKESNGKISFSMVDPDEARGGRAATTSSTCCSSYTTMLSFSHCSVCMYCCYASSQPH